MLFTTQMSSQLDPNFIYQCLHGTFKKGARKISVHTAWKRPGYS